MGKELDYIFPERKCARCGRLFLAAPQHALKLKVGGERTVWFCKPSCLLGYSKDREDRKTKGKRICVQKNDIKA